MNLFPLDVWTWDQRKLSQSLSGGRSDIKLQSCQRLFSYHMGKARLQLKNSNKY